MSARSYVNAKHPLGQVMLVALAAAAVVSGCGRESKDQTGLEAEQGAELLLEDDFSDRQNGWPTGPDSAGEVGYEKDAYRVRVIGSGDQRSAMSLAQSAEILAVEADVTERAGPRTSESAGLICLTGNQERAGYEFDVSPAGGFFGIVRLDAKGDEVVSTGAIPGVKEVGSANRLRVLCVGKDRGGTRLVLWVNGTKVSDTTDQAGYDLFTGVALTAGSPEKGTTALFDNLVVVTLPRKALPSRGPPAPPQTASTVEVSKTTQAPPTEGDSESLVCTKDGIRYVGSTREGAKVCFTLTRDGRGLIESGWSFVQASGCPDEAEGHSYSTYPGDVDESGHFENPDGFTATVSGDTAAGVFEDTDICPGKKFAWTATRVDG